MLKTFADLYRIIKLTGTAMQLWAIVALAVFSAVIETFGIALVFPFIAALTMPDYFKSTGKLHKLAEILGFHSQHRFLVFMGFAVLAVVVFGNILMALTSWLSYRYSFMQESRISVLLLSRYLNKPYIFFLKNNLNNLAKNIVNEVAIVIRDLFISALEIISKGAVLIVMLSFLLCYNPLFSLIMISAIASVYAIYSGFCKKRIRQKSAEFAQAHTLRFKYSIESLNAIQDIKLLSAENFFLKQFEKPSRDFANASSTSKTLASLPRNFLELFLFGGILTFILINILDNSKSFNLMLPILSTFAYAGIRMLPAMNILYHSYSVMKFSKHSLDVLYDDLISGGDVVGQSDTDLNFNHTIHFKNLGFSYGDEAGNVIENINFKINKGESVGFVGGTGSGKTTVINILLGLLAPSEGEVLIDGLSLCPRNLQDWQKNIGHVPQNIYLVDDTILNNIAFGIELEKIDFSWLRKVAQIAELDEFIMSLPENYNTLVGDRGVRLSGGQRQRIGIARSLYRRPKVLVLDEATSALDNITEARVIENIRSECKGLTLIMVAHRLTTVKKCDKILVLVAKKGVVSEGSYDALLESSPEFQDLVSANVT